MLYFLILLGQDRLFLRCAERNLAEGANKGANKKWQCAPNLVSVMSVSSTETLALDLTTALPVSSMLFRREKSAFGAAMPRLRFCRADCMLPGHIWLRRNRRSLCPPP